MDNSTKKNRQAIQPPNHGGMQPTYLRLKRPTQILARQINNENDQSETAFYDVLNNARSSLKIRLKIRDGQRKMRLKAAKI